MQKYEEVLNRFKEAEHKIHSLSYSTSMLFWDASTGAPKSGADARSQAVGVLSGFQYQLLVNEQMNEDLNTLMANLDALDEVDRVLVKDAKKEYDKMTKIPMDEFQKYNMLISKSSIVWEDDKAKSDFEMFRRNLTEVIDYLLKFA